MYNSKALQILRTFSKKELSRLADYAASPYCNTNSKTSKILTLLLPYHPRFDQADLEKKRFYKKLRPRKAYDDAYLRKQLSGLYQMIRDFLADEGIKAQPFLLKTALLQQLQERELDHVFQIHFNQAVEELQEQPRQDADFYYHAFRLSAEGDAFAERLQDPEAEDYLQASLDNLDIFYLVTKLQKSCAMVSLRHAMKAEYRMHLLKEVLSFLKTDQNPFLQVPAVKLYRQTLSMLLAPTEERHFFALLEMLRAHAGSFSRQELSRIYRYPQQYCLEKIKSGQREYVDHLFELYRDQLESGALFREEHLPAETYKNIVILGLGLGAFDWVKTFLHEYRERLPEQQRQDVFYYSLANYLESSGEVDSAAKLLEDTRFSDPYYQVNGQYLLIKLYFKQAKWTELLDLIDDFRLYLLRDQALTTMEKQGIVNFLIILKRMAGLQKNGETMTRAEKQVQAQKITDRLEKADPLFNAHWLREQWERQCQ